MKRWLDPGLFAVAATLGLALAWDAGYRAWSFESLLVLLAALCAASVLTLLTRRSSAVRIALLGVLFFWTVDIFYVPSNAWGWALLAGGTAALVLARRHVSPHFFVAAALVFLGGMALRPAGVPQVTQAVPRQAAGAPPQILVHWVLDEMGSFEALPREYRVQADVDEITQAYRRRGFELPAAKASTSESTALSLSRMVSGAPAALAVANHVAHEDGSDGFRVQGNVLHEKLAGRGWDVDITQSSYLDFCSSTRFNCTTYDVGNGAWVFSEAGISWAERGGVLGRELLATLMREQRGSALVAALRDEVPNLFRRYAPEVCRFKEAPGEKDTCWGVRPTLPLAMLHVLDAHVQRVRSMSGKAYVFAHVLLPHHPFTLDRDCTVLSRAQWRYPYDSWLAVSPQARVETFRAYWRQQYCAHKKVLSAIDALDAAHPGQVQFVIHGDHGPRLLARNGRPALAADPLGSAAARDLFAPFLAVRVRDVADVGRAASMQEAVNVWLEGASLQPPPRLQP